ncbi:hypothetical protein GDO86_016980 [Hymenochirus boettgeri]|uniref:Uncharacterized protein n=1 Tax=Hymenochirus boettgeri TaxID=247094 RepID=A0A8T2IQW4_9PIPI|nr:hypothetical protein GDO86_016980 [Hymenochirus boettgeri]
MWGGLHSFVFWECESFPLFYPLGVVDLQLNVNPKTLSLSEFHSLLLHFIFPSVCITFPLIPCVANKLNNCVCAREEPHSCFWAFTSL